MADDTEGFTADQAALATTALREALGLAPERFPLEQFVPMISDEIDKLRQAGRSDQDIVDLLRAKAGLEVPVDALDRFYASPESRHVG